MIALPIVLKGNAVTRDDLEQDQRTLERMRLPKPTKIGVDMSDVKLCNHTDLGSATTCE
jgi:hypothetical protein